MSQPKVIIITGANSGIGKAMAMELGAAGHHIVMGCRSLGRGEAAQAEIQQHATGSVDLLQVDVGQPDSVREFAAQVVATYPRVDVLMNNAGVYLPKRELDRFIEAMISIRKEIARVESGELDAQSNPLKHAPHTLADIMDPEWQRGYSKEEAAWPVASLKDNKFWPAVNRIDNVYGDRNLYCACPPMENYL